eukprot:416251_1
MLSNSLDNDEKQRNEIKNLQQQLKNSNNKMISIKNKFDAESKILKKNLQTAQDDRNIFQKQMNEAKSKQQKQVFIQANTIKSLQKQLDDNNYKHKKETNDLKSMLESKVHKIDQKEKEIKQLTVSIHQLQQRMKEIQINSKQETEIIQLTQKQQIESLRKTQTEIRNRLIASTCTIDLSTQLPVIEDVIYKYDMIKTQLHTQAAKLIRGKLKQQTVYSQMRISKMAN